MGFSLLVHGGRGVTHENGVFTHFTARTSPEPRPWARMMVFFKTSCRRRCSVGSAGIYYLILCTSADKAFGSYKYSSIAFSTLDIWHNHTKARALSNHNHLRVSQAYSELKEWYNQCKTVISSLKKLQVLFFRHPPLWIYHTTLSQLSCTYSKAKARNGSFNQTSITIRTFSPNSVIKADLKKKKKREQRI